MDVKKGQGFYSSHVIKFHDVFILPRITFTCDRNINHVQDEL